MSERATTATSGVHGSPGERRPAPWRRTIVWAASAVALVGCGAGAGAEPERSYTLQLRMEDSADEYAYIAEEAVDLRVGDEVTFVVRNDGTLPHDLQVVDPSGDDIATAPPVVSGETLTLTVLFEEPGFYQLNCLVDDHLTAHGMQAIIEVTDP